MAEKYTTEQAMEQFGLPKSEIDLPATFYLPLIEDDLTDSQIALWMTNILGALFGVKSIEEVEQAFAEDKTLSHTWQRAIELTEAFDEQ